MGRWMKPEVYPLMAAMSFVTGMCIFQLTRNVILNPDVSKSYNQKLFNTYQFNKAHRSTAILENQEKEKSTQSIASVSSSAHGREVMPAVNRFFSENK
ncbi:hypothetical protein DH2020_009540 [Rehmannia glutinosa]|uniref:NADH-ubiquinone reductase complex 1 MLRQ subunit n=1 Tax=Rehmannia glutinosa TaxID=99300 RepID=A0ABR0X990_REHGL